MSSTSTPQPPARREGEDIHELFLRVQQHPDFVFGAIFVLGDFADATVPDAFSPKWATGALAERGNAMIVDAGRDARRRRRRAGRRPVPAARVHGRQ
jgi:hypothetical protein